MLRLLGLFFFVVAFLTVATGLGQNDAQARTMKTDGKIKSLALEKDEMQVTGKADSKDYKFSVGTHSKVRVNDRDGKLADLKLGDEVSVSWRREGDRMVVLSITTLRKQQ